MGLIGPPPRFYRRWCVYGRSPQDLISSVALRAPRLEEHQVIRAWGPTVVLDEVWTAPRHRGLSHATGLLGLAQKFALRSGWFIICKPFAHGAGGSQKKLEAFYRAAEFNPLPDQPGWWMDTTL